MPVTRPCTALAAAEPDLIAVVGGGTADREYDAGRGRLAQRLRDPVTVGEGEPVLPLSLTVGRWLLDRAGIGAGAQRPGWRATGAAAGGQPAGVRR